MVGERWLRAGTRRRISRAAGDIARSATSAIDERFSWYGELSAPQRASVGQVVSAGVGAFVNWLDLPRASGRHDPLATAAIFGAAPQELAHTITLSHTIDLIRTVVEVVEPYVLDLVDDSEQQRAREAILVYGRDLAFSAAEVYAHAAETRGAWDARLEALVVDSVMRGEADAEIDSRAAALGWSTPAAVTVVVGTTSDLSAAAVVDQVHQLATRTGIRVLAAVHAQRLILILDADQQAAVDAARALDRCFGPGPVVLGPSVPHLLASGRSARAALSGHAVAAAHPRPSRPMSASDLLAERALGGDLPARAALGDRIIRPLRDHGDGQLLQTARVFLESGGGIESTARALIVHPNTVRYRLGTIASLTGYELTDAHDAFTVRLALAYDLLPSGRR